jgi:hypothetical protein
MGGDQQIVAGTQIALALSVDPQARRPTQQQHPLIMGLIIGGVHRGGLAIRDNPLDPDARTRKQLLELLLRYVDRKVFEEIGQ